MFIEPQAATPSARRTADEVIARLRPKLAQIPGITLFLQAVQDVRVGGRMSRTQYQYTLRTPTSTSCTTWAPARAREAARRCPS